jgi:AhpD family alkylhydroperoxidase
MSEATPGLRSESALRGWTGPLGLRDIFVTIPKHAIALVECYEKLMRGPSPLSAGEREMIYAYLSRRNDCHFCFTSHSACAVALGIDRSLFALPQERIDQMALRPEVRKALRFALALNLPGVERGQLDDARDQVGRLPRELVRDTVLVAALTAFINRVIDGLGASLSDELHARNGAHLAEHGYVQVIDQVRTSLEAAGHGAAPSQPFDKTSPFPAFGDKAPLLAWFSRFQQDVLDGGPLPNRQARAIREAVAGANGIAMAEPPKPDPFIHFAVELTLRPHWRGLADSAALYESGGSDAHLRQVVLITALGNFLDRVVIGLPTLFDRNTDLDSLLWGHK